MGTLKVDASPKFPEMVRVFKEVLSETQYSLAKYANPDNFARFSYIDKPN